MKPAAPFRSAARVRGTMGGGPHGECAQPLLNERAREAFDRLKKEELVLEGRVKPSPCILCRHGRWHMVTIDRVRTRRGALKKGIAAVRFLTRREAQETVARWLAASELRPPDAILPFFRQELDAKVAPAAEAYRPLLESGAVELVVGHTTDTLCALGSGDVDALLALIGRMMRGGASGYLRFTRFLAE